MRYDLDAMKSHLWSSLFEFGEEVFVVNRKKLKLRQKHIADRIGLNQSEISRLERGIAKPKDITTVEALCDVYKLTPPQRSKYLELTCGVTQSQDNVILSSLLINQVTAVANLNRSGSPLFAIEQAQILSKWIEANIDIKSKPNRDIVETLSLLLLEESAAWWDAVESDQVTKHTDSLLTRMENLRSIKDNDDVIINYIQINKGFHSYIKGDYFQARKYFNSVIQSRLDKDKQWLYEILRASIITSGQLKDYEMLQKSEKKAFSLIQDSSVEDTSKAYLFEGLGRAYTYLDANKSLNFLNLSFAYSRKKRKEPNFLTIRYIQLIRSQVALLKKLNKDKDELYKIAAPAIRDTDKGNYVRHKAEILKLLRE